jgi:glutathione S-transferase
MITAAGRKPDFHADLEKRLIDEQFIAGERFSVADITVVVSIDLATAALSLAVPDCHIATRRWSAAIAGRPSFAA